MPRLRRAATCIQTVEKALAWLLALLAPDGSYGEGNTTLLTNHKAGVVFTRSGHVEESRRCIQWAEEHLRQPDGSFRPADGGPRVNMTAWVTLGAHLNGCFDLSVPGIRFLAERQGKDTGGVYESTDAGPADAFNVLTTSSAGMAFLYCGQLAPARAVGRALCRVLESQPGDGRFMTRFDRRFRAVEPPPDAVPREYFLRPSEPFEGLKAVSHSTMLTALSESKGMVERPNQAYAALGMPIGFLSKLYRATDEDAFLEAAESYLDLAAGCAEDAWASVEAAPIAWGAAIYYNITRSRKYLDHAEKIVGFLIDNQREDGTWLVKPFDRLTAASVVEGGQYDSIEQQPLPVTIATVTATALVLIECLREVQ